MAKKSTKSDRQAVIDEIRKKQKGAEKRRGFAIVGVCALVAVLIVAAAAYRPVKNWWDLRKFKDIDLASIGAPGVGAATRSRPSRPTATSSTCRPAQQVTYTTAPPAFGSHWNEPGVAPGAVQPEVLHRRTTGPSSRRWCTTSSTATRSSGTTRRSPTTPTS